MCNISLTFATGSAEFAVFNIAPTISAIHINELVSTSQRKTIAQNGGKVEERVNTGDSIH